MADEPLARVDNPQFYALDPEQLAHAQTGLVAWAEEKVRTLRAQFEEQGRALEDAARTPFSNQQAQWRRELNKTGEVIDFYEKVRDALAAGYIIVPDFPINVFAIRTDADAPSGETVSHTYHRRMEFPQAPGVLPAGEGRNVAPIPATRHEDFKNEKDEIRRRWVATTFREVAFPARLVRAEILTATQKALALKVFDEVGMVGTPRKADPIVVGKIIDPRDKYRQRKIAFFIVWWLDTATL